MRARGGGYRRWIKQFLNENFGKLSSRRQLQLNWAIPPNMLSHSVHYALLFIYLVFLEINYRLLKHSNKIFQQIFCHNSTIQIVIELFGLDFGLNFRYFMKYTHTNIILKLYLFKERTLKNIFYIFGLNTVIIRGEI